MTTVLRQRVTGRPEARRTAQARQIDKERLGAHLRAAGIQGEVRFDDGSRALYSTDGSNYRQVPIGVVLPKTAEDIVRTVSICRQYGAPILSRGGGTSLAGQCCNVAVVMDMSKYYNSILELDPVRNRARVQPGIVLDELRKAAEHHQLTFAPDPSTHSHCTLGGMIGNNSCGVHSVMGGKTVDNVEELEILTYDGFRMRVGPTPEDELERIIAEGGRRGQIYRDLRDLRDRYANLIREKYPDIPRRVSGYNLTALLPEQGFNVAKALVGSEGTCVTILEATLRLVWSPPGRSLLVLGYPDVATAGDHVSEVMTSGPIALEGMDDDLVEDMKKKNLHPQDVQLLPDGKGWLLVEFGGHRKQDADDAAHFLMDRLRGLENPPSMKLFTDPAEEHIIWKVRESGLGATARVPGEPDTWEGWEDAAVPVPKLGDYLRDFRALLNRYGYNCALYGHFGQACVHTRIDFDLKSRPGIEHYRDFLDDAADLVVRYGGSLSGEHGDGQSRAALLPKMFGDELVQAFGEFKAIWDPEGKINPGKLVDPYQPTENLRYGADYNPERPKTYFQFPDDKNDFSYATERCVGVGECRRHEGGTMCPSYMVTREEKHSTRGRARLLWEMLQGEVIPGAWKDDAVRESLDLCLACKGCKGDCPMNVDMATYKAEFLAHYYEGRMRPMAAYTMGLIYWWARLAAWEPGLVNFMANIPGISRLGKLAMGIEPERSVPRFAKETFKSQFRKRPKQKTGGRRVILWADTFNNHFFPSITMAAVEVLEAAGCEVVVPQQSLCCGRPLYDWGMLGTAQKLWHEILDALRDEIHAGTPVVGLEPSCVAAFRDELINLYPDDPDAQRLSRQTFMLSEFLVNELDGYQPPQLKRKAIVQGHCHHQAIMKFDAEQELMRRMGLDFEVLDSGCCGMAGSFGFQHGEQYGVSIAAGERVLLPRVRRENEQVLILADGFSCREQIEQGTERRGLHIVQALQMALHDGAGGTQLTPPEEEISENWPTRPRGRTLALAGGATAGAALWLMKRKRR